MLSYFKMADANKPDRKAEILAKHAKMAGMIGDDNTCSLILLVMLVARESPKNSSNATILMQVSYAFAERRVNPEELFLLFKNYYGNGQPTINDRAIMRVLKAVHPPKDLPPLRSLEEMSVTFNRDVLHLCRILSADEKMKVLPADVMTAVCRHMQIFKNNGVSPAIYLVVLRLVMKKMATASDLVLIYKMYKVKPEMSAFMEAAFVKLFNIAPA